MTAEILAVGTELLLGEILNTDAQYIASELAKFGVNLLHQSVVGDNPERLAQAIRQALSRSDMLITTGGLGPTGDDITRETVAQVLGLKLVLHEPSLEQIKHYFARTGRTMSDSNIKQAMLPEKAEVFANEWGTAPGCLVTQGGKTVVMLPGPPREMRPMFEKYVVPRLAALSDSAIASIYLRVFGLPEADIQTLLGDLMRGQNPTLSPYAKDGEVLLRVTAKAPGRDEALALCRPLAGEVKRRLGDKVYGENVSGLPQVVLESLREKGMRIAFAESCTGGLAAKLLTDLPGSSEVFDCGVVCYANHIKMKLLGVREQTLADYGAVSPQTAREMACGVRRLAGADIGLGITGIAGPGGGTDDKPVGLVYVSAAGAGGVYTRRLLLGHGMGDERGLIRYLAALNAYDMARRMITGLPQHESAEYTPC